MRAIVDRKMPELADRRASLDFPASGGFHECVCLTFFKIGHNEYLGMLTKNCELNFTWWRARARFFSDIACPFGAPARKSGRSFGGVYRSNWVNLTISRRHVKISA